MITDVLWKIACSPSEIYRYSTPSTQDLYTQMHVSHILLLNRRLDQCSMPPIGYRWNSELCVMLVQNGEDINSIHKCFGNCFILCSLFLSMAILHYYSGISVWIMILQSPAKFGKVETPKNVSTTFWEKKNQNVIVPQHLSCDNFQVLVLERNTERLRSIRKIFDKGFQKLSKSGIHLILI